MSTTPPEPPPSPPAAPPPRRSRLGGCLLVLSLLGNVILLGTAVTIAIWPLVPDDSDDLEERHFLGNKSATNKIAIVRISGVLVEGNTGFATQQLLTASKDKHVKAVLLRIDSPGGTISASEELHRSIVDLRDNTGRVSGGSGPKPVFASMGGIAASGGYYIAMPAQKIVAEPVTITGSIGVFAALPNVAELAHNNGIRVELIKAGSIKAGGSMFHKLTPDERQPWQDVVDHAYDRFLAVVSEGRPKLTRDVLVNDKIRREVPKYDEKGNVILGPNGKPEMVPHVRYRADGGTYTAPQAKELGLVDDLSDLPTAVKRAAESVGLTDFRAITYDRPKSVAEQLLGVNLSQSTPPSTEWMRTAMSPKLWYLTPGYESAGLLAGQ